MPPFHDDCHGRNPFEGFANPLDVGSPGRHLHIVQELACTRERNKGVFGQNGLVGHPMEQGSICAIGHLDIGYHCLEGHGNGITVSHTRLPGNFPCIGLLVLQTARDHHLSDLHQVFTVVGVFTRLTQLRHCQGELTPAGGIFAFAVARLDLGRLFQQP